jgi:hypothetical protein
MRTITVMCLVALFAIACSGASSDKRDKSIGGCEIDTITIGTGLVRAPAPRGRAARIEILSIAPAGEDRYRRAAVELIDLLDSLGVAVYSSSELLHVKRGPCWPAYRITFLIDLTQGNRGETIRTALAATHLTGAASTAERPEGYGLFFVTCGKGDRDWWTVWYSLP